MPLYDSHGRVIETPSRPPVVMQGVPLIQDRRFSYASQNLTPVALASILKEADMGNTTRQCDLADEMLEKDPDLSSLLQTRKLALQGLGFEILPASEEPEDERINAFVKDVIADLKLDSATVTLADACWKGFSGVNIRWDILDGDAVPVYLQGIPPRRFTFQFWDAQWDSPLPQLPRILTAKNPSFGEDLEQWSAIVHLDTLRSLFPQRAGLLRPVSFPYCFKSFSTKDWLIFLEKYAQPTRIGKYTNAAGPKEIQVLHQAVQSLGVDAAAVIADSTVIELLEAKNTGASSGVYDLFIDRTVKSYAKAILGQTATTEGTPGALGNEKSRAEVRHDILVADATMLATTWREQLIWPIVGFNFGWEKRLPLFRYHTDEEEDLDYLSRIHERFAKLGVPIPLSFIRKKYNIPEPLQGEAVLQVASPPPPLEEEPSLLSALLLKKKVPVGNRRIPFNWSA